MAEPNASTAVTGSLAPALAELRRMLGPAARANEPLARYTSLRVGGPADLFFVARTSEQLADAVDRAAQAGVPWRIIGGASNLLIADEGIEGLVVKAASNQHTVIDEGIAVRAEAGCMLAAVGKQMALRGVAGMEWAVNVPGTVGASVVNNSGAFGSSVSEHLMEARLFIPGAGIESFGVEDLGLAYRTSRLKRGEVAAAVLDATYRLSPGDSARLRARIAEIQRMRRATQPSGYSVGSVFANPEGDASGRLIEAAGLKGYRIGEAEVSTLHANFIVNRGGARAQDVLALIRHIQGTVQQRFGVWLRPEVQIVGRFGAEAIDGLYSPPGGVA